MTPLARLLDRLRRPEETPTMRQYRRWRDSTGRGEPYRLSTTGPVTEQPTKTRTGRHTPPSAPVVGVTMEWHRLIS